MTMLEELKSLGADVDDGLGRVMGDRDLYEMMLGMFIGSVNESAITPEAFDSPNNTEDLIKKIHMLKGVTGNLALTPLFTSYTEILGQLRAGQIKDAKAGYEKILPAQTAIMECIQRGQAG